MVTVTCHGLVIVNPYHEDIRMGLGKLKQLNMTKMENVETAA